MSKKGLLLICLGSFHHTKSHLVAFKNAGSHKLYKDGLIGLIKNVEYLIFTIKLGQKPFIIISRKSLDLPTYRLSPFLADKID